MIKLLLQVNINQGLNSAVLRYNRIPVRITLHRPAGTSASA